jgi:hypothetical protein
LAWHNVNDETVKWPNGFAMKNYKSKFPQRLLNMLKAATGDRQQMTLL